MSERAFKIPIFMYNDELLGQIDEQERLAELGLGSGEVEVNLDDCDIDYRYFVNIDNFGTYKADKGKTIISSGGEQYISPLSIEELLKGLLIE